MINWAWSFVISTCIFPLHNNHWWVKYTIQDLRVLHQLKNYICIVEVLTTIKISLHEGVFNFHSGAWSLAVLSILELLQADNMGIIRYIITSQVLSLKPGEWADQNTWKETSESVWWVCRSGADATSVFEQLEFFKQQRTCGLQTWQGSNPLKHDKWGTDQNVMMSEKGRVEALSVKLCCWCSHLYRGSTVLQTYR